MPIQMRRRGGFLAGLLSGASVLVLAGATPLAAELSIDWSKATATRIQIAESDETGETGEGGESGEGGEGGAFAAAAPDERFAANLLAMKGHLLSALELYDDGEIDAAAPHFEHPRAEHLAAVEPMLDEHGAGELGEELEQVETAAYGEGGESGAIETTWTEAVEAIDAGLEDAIDGSPARLMSVSLLVLRQAAHEYEEAIEGDAFALEHEYQDGRGFYRAVRGEIESHADELNAIDAAKYAELVAALDAVGQAWPGAMPPASPPVTTAELNAAIAGFEIAALAFR